MSCFKKGLSLMMFGCCFYSAFGGASEFAGVRRAEVKMTNGMPVMLLDGKPEIPLIFFFNNEAAGQIRQAYHTPQVTMASKAGVHIYSFVADYSSDDGFSVTKKEMDRYIAIDPEALFLLRVPLYIPRNLKKEYSEESIVFADGTTATGMVSHSSEKAWSFIYAQLAKFVRHFEDDAAYGKRIVAYHLENNEWFNYSYRIQGPDLSEPNNAGFRRWLKEKYKVDKALQAAWANSEITLESARVPVPEKGRFPIRGGGDDLRESFFRIGEEENWIDYSKYTSYITSKRIIDTAGIVKRETNGTKLTGAFYGYLMELPGSISGHLVTSQ